MQEAPLVESIYISVRWENDRPIFVLNNRGQHEEDISIYYQIHGHPNIKYPWITSLLLTCRESKTLVLPEEYKKWEKLGFEVSGKRSWVSMVGLRDLLNKAKRQVETDPSNSGPEQLINDSSISEVSIENTQEIKPEYASIDHQKNSSTNISNAQESITDLTQNCEDNESIDSVDIENPTPSQKVPLILNSIVHDIEKWINELDQSYVRNPDLVQTLVYAKQTIKEKLKTISNNEQGYEIDTAEYDQFIPQFIKDRLFNGVARFIPYEQLPEHLDTLLQLVGYEIIPIDIGKTKADARVHDIQGSRQTGVEPGTIAEVILPGLRWIIDGEIVQKPVVIRAE